MPTDRPDFSNILEQIQKIHDILPDEPDITISKVKKSERPDRSAMGLIKQQLADNNDDDDDSNDVGALPNTRVAQTKIIVKTPVIYTDIFAASEHGDVDAIRKFVTQDKIPVDSTDSKRRTPLHLAARAGHLNAVLELLDLGADPNFVGSGQLTPLHWVCYNGHERVAAVLIEGGARVSAVDDKGRTPIMWAVKGGQLKCVQQCVQYEASMKGLLLLAANVDHPDVIRDLCDNGADINERGAQGLTPLHIAIQAGLPNNVQALIECDADVNSVDEVDKTPLHYAAVAGDDVSVTMLVKANANIDAVDKWGESPLHMAAICRNGSAVVRVLVDHGADPVRCTTGGNTPLHFAAKSGTLETMKILLSQQTVKDDINARNRQMATPLHLAAFEGHIDAVSLLIDAGADVKIVDKVWI